MVTRGSFMWYFRKILPATLIIGCGGLVLLSPCLLVAASALVLGGR